ncbi:hypothetical protein QBC35DRAFT_505894 [Podospora australis]|uniref:MI domain-containing protein n=1 Tax=Podospora australis TaxID=1536484 RepID=A0AAN7AFY4_9PEZI|nr:hypothetical protein QBC35DRAFT_505894 [Podospora australis]
MVRFGQGVVKRPMLPPHLLKELGVSSDSNSNQGRDSSVTSRKDRRKNERQDRRTGRTEAAQTHRNERLPQKSKTPPQKPIAKTERKPTTTKKVQALSDSEDDEFDGFGNDEVDGDLPDDILNENSDEGEDDDEDMSVDLDEDEDEDDQEEDDDETLRPANKQVSKTTMDKLVQDDAEIADLEKKLGLKGRKKLPQSFMEDGLGELLGELGGFDEEKTDKRKRKAEADEWLAQKRRKAETALQQQKQPHLGKTDGDESDLSMDEEEKEEEDDVGDSGSDDDFDEDEDDDSGEGTENEAEEEAPAKKVRENPYVAPTTGQIAKYVPPARRQENGSDAELAARVRRQTQGLINRITESNLLTILTEIEKLYREYPRQHVSSAVVDLLLVQVCEPTSLPDTLLILTAGFASAAYKVLGTDVGAQLVQEVVERFDKYYEAAKEDAAAGHDAPKKQTSNLITFISQLYNFQLLGPNLVFDYIRLLLDSLSELNAELLLRVVRMCGPTLRQDDPMALKDIATLIPAAVAKYGEKNMTVRTKFMIETITDLKNNKLKTGAGASAVVSEHTTRMKKTLGQLKSRKLKATEPLRIGLKDIRDAEKTGKWWLVGASWAGRSGDKNAEKQPTVDEQAGDGDSDDESFAIDNWDDGPDLLELAREQGMNTEVRRSIFVTILSALDFQDAYHRILKLRLNKKRQREIPTVIITCLCAEQYYNPYYTLIAKKVCENMREVKWSFQRSLWKLFARMGETDFGDEDETFEEEEQESEFENQQVINTAKMFGSLVASGHMSFVALRRLNIPYLQRKTRNWLEIMINTVLLECQTGEKPGDGTIIKVFGTAVEAVPELARGLQYFLKRVTRKTDLAGGKKNTKKVKEGCKMAEAALEAVIVGAEGTA